MSFRHTTCKYEKKKKKWASKISQEDVTRKTWNASLNLPDNLFIVSLEIMHCIHNRMFLLVRLDDLVIAHFNFSATG